MLLVQDTHIDLDKIIFILEKKNKSKNSFALSKYPGKRHLEVPNLNC